MDKPGAFGRRISARPSSSESIELNCPCCYRPGNPLCENPSTALTPAQKLEALRGLLIRHDLDAYIVVGAHTPHISFYARTLTNEKIPPQTYRQALRGRARLRVRLRVRHAARVAQRLHGKRGHGGRDQDPGAPLDRQPLLPQRRVAGANSCFLICSTMKKSTQLEGRAFFFFVVADFPFPRQIVAQQGMDADEVLRARGARGAAACPSLDTRPPDRRSS